MPLQYVFSESQRSPSADPLVMWVRRQQRCLPCARRLLTPLPFAQFNGGPGCSSMEGCFSESGPYTVEEYSSPVTLKQNPWSWNRVSNNLCVLVSRLRSFLSPLLSPSPLLSSLLALRSPFLSSAQARTNRGAHQPQTLLCAASLRPPLALATLTATRARGATTPTRPPPRTTSRRCSPSTPRTRRCRSRTCTSPASRM